MEKENGRGGTEGQNREEMRKLCIATAQRIMSEEEHRGTIVEEGPWRLARKEAGTDLYPFFLSEGLEKTWEIHSCWVEAMQKQLGERFDGSVLVEFYGAARH